MNAREMLERIATEERERAEAALQEARDATSRAEVCDGIAAGLNHALELMERADRDYSETDIAERTRAIDEDDLDETRVIREMLGLMEGASMSRAIAELQSVFAARTQRLNAAEVRLNDAEARIKTLSNLVY